jgi:hypothetical protein
LCCWESTFFSHLGQTWSPIHEYAPENQLWLRFGLASTKGYCLLSATATTSSSNRMSTTAFTREKKYYPFGGSKRLREFFIWHYLKFWFPIWHYKTFPSLFDTRWFFFSLYDTTVHFVSPYSYFYYS